MSQKMFEYFSILSRLGARRLIVLGLIGISFTQIRLYDTAEQVFRHGRRLTERRYRKRLPRAGDVWDLLANRAAARRGAEHHPDPLLDIRVWRRRQQGTSRRVGEGRSWVFAAVVPSGLHLFAVLLGRPRTAVVLYADEDAIARFAVRSALRIPGTTLVLSRGSFTLKRPTLQRLPRRVTLTVRRDDDDRHTIGKGNMVVDLPTGDGTLTERNFPRADKKGFPVGGKKSVTALQHQLEQLYGAAAAHFRTALDKDLFLIYGTLLGPIREGRFLPWDDDFDVAYFSEARSLVDLRAETVDVMQSLARAGFEVGLNRRGRPFRLSDSRGLGSLRLDVRPVWEMEGSVWAAKHARLSLNRGHFLPVKSIVVGERNFLVPNDPEAFLSAYYGDDWRTPKPGYREVMQLDRTEAQIFKSLRLTQGEILSINEVLAAEPALNGHIPAIRHFGGTPLYPLEERQRVVGV